MENRLIVSAIIINDKGEIFLQKRFKPKASPAYLNVWEIPAGGVDNGEDVVTAIKREVFEESGLIVELVDPKINVHLDNSNGKNDKVQVFEPYLCQQMLETDHGLGWVGFVFICKVVGGTVKMNMEEAKDPTWMDLKILKDTLDAHPEEFFSLQVPVLKDFVKKNFN